MARPPSEPNKFYDLPSALVSQIDFMTRSPKFYYLLTPSDPNPFYDHHSPPNVSNAFH